MHKKFVLIGLFVVLFLVACGGSPSAEPAAPPASNEGNSTDNSETAATSTPEPEPTLPSSEESINTDTADNSTDTGTDEVVEDEAETAEEPDTAEEPVEEGAFVAGLPASGIDPETGLEINPPQIVQGQEFIVRGTIISYNLTPQTTPEFLVEAPSGMRYRVRSQGISDIYYGDGTQLKAFEYKIGLLAQATVLQETTAGVTTVVETDNFMLLHDQ